MKYLFPLLWLVQVAWAQDLLTPQSEVLPPARSPLTYLHRLSDEQVQVVLREGLSALPSAALATPQDSSTEVPPTPTEPGYYLLSYATGHQEQRDLLTVYRWQAYVVNNERDLMVAVYDAAGNPLTDAKVTLEDKLLPFDSLSQTYRLPKSRREGLLRVDYAGYRDYYRIEARRSRLTLLRIAQRVAWTPPIRWIWRVPYRFVADAVKSLRWRSAQGWVRWVVQPFTPDFWRRDYRGYLALDKPKHRPGDTVHLKALLMRPNGKPLNRPLTLYLRKNYGRSTFPIAELTPYRPGAYRYTWLPHDSLELRQGEQMFLYLRGKRGRSYFRTSFHYQDYELKSTDASFSVSQNLHHRGETVTLRAHMYDENHLNEPGARVRLSARTQGEATPQAARVFVPQTLWIKEQVLDPLGPTEILLPDSLFPAAHLRYQLMVEFLSADGERIVETEAMVFRYDTCWLVLEERGDSLWAYRQGCPSDSDSAELLTYLPGQRRLTQTVPLPWRQPITAQAQRYRLRQGERTADLLPEQALVQISAQHRADSLRVRIDNPRGLPLWYQLWEGKKKSLARGQVRQLDRRWTVKPRETYFLTVAYLWRGAMQKKEYRLAPEPHRLRVEFDAPEKIYPGQTTELALRVQDFRGQPVADADVLAYGFTSKFDQSGASIPPVKHKVTQRRSYNHFSATRPDASQRAALDYVHWRERYGLDSLQAYRFLYPADSLFAYATVAPDSFTQLAAYVVDSGVIEPVLVSYVDAQPHYVNAALNPYGYTQPIDSGWHHLRLRTAGYLIEVDSVYVPQGHLLLLSLDQQTFARSFPQEDATLSLTEARQLSRYLMPIQPMAPPAYAYVQQRGRNFPLHHSRISRSARSGPSFIGPIFPGYYQAIRPGDFSLRNRFEPNWSYEFGPELIKMRSHAWNFDRLRLQLSYRQDWSDRWPRYAWSEAWQQRAYQHFVEQRQYQHPKFSNPIRTTAGYGTLKLEWKEAHLPVELGLLFQAGNTEFLRLYPARDLTFHQLGPGTYRYLGWSKDGTFFRLDSLTVQADGTTYYRVEDLAWQPADSLMQLLFLDATQRWHSKREADSLRDRIREVDLRATYGDVNGLFSTRVRGRVFDPEGNPLMGAAVLVKGTTIGTFTDENGYYELNAPLEATLLITYVGMERQEVVAQAEGNEIQMQLGMVTLDEVVVTGLGRQREGKTLSYAVSAESLTGKVVGAQAGATSLDSEALPVVSVETLRGGTSEVPLTDLLQAPATMRSNFRDVAYWRPALRTDARGEARFEVTFPDDITRWEQFGLVYDAAGRRTGQAQQGMLSYQALMAELSLPRFLVADDEATAFGKARNLTGDSLAAQLSFITPDQTYQQKDLRLGPAALDTLRFTAPAGQDSLQLTFRLDLPANEYFDGEKRDIPLFPLGDVTTEGNFWLLAGDSTVAVDLPTGELHLRAQGSLLEVLLDEVKHIWGYRYLCNEQAASKLKALLAEQRIRERLGKKFRRKKDVEAMIAQLMRSRNEERLWGWWKGNPTSYWISTHVLEALLRAREMGYAVSLDEEVLGQALVYPLNQNKTAPRRNVDLLWLLHRLDQPVKFEDFIAAAEQDSFLALTDHLRLQRLRQARGLPYQLDTLWHYQQANLYQGLYWGGRSYFLRYSSLETTLQAYALLREHGGQETALLRIRAWLLRQRGVHGWGNTYQSSRVLETLLPDLLEDGALPAAPMLIVEGQTRRDTIREFPYEAVWTEEPILRLRQQGKLPVYASVYRQYFDPAPQAVDSVFAVRSWWNGAQRPDTALRAGVPATLTVEVRSVRDADYVLIEVPIPAGCSYAEEGRGYGPYEVYREQRRDRVAICCRRLPAGTHRYQVRLQPRFPGRYTLNPARVEEMYFPVFFGRNGLKKTEIE